CAGCGARLDLDPLGKSPGTRHLDAQADRGPRRRGPTQPRQRHAPREPDGLGRTRTGARCALYGRDRGRSVQSGDPSLLSALAASGQSQEGRPHRLYAEVADDSQCDAETSDALARGGGTPCLNLKTVADTFSCSGLPTLNLRRVLAYRIDAQAPWSRWRRRRSDWYKDREVARARLTIGRIVGRNKVVLDLCRGPDNQTRRLSQRIEKRRPRLRRAG